MSKTIIPKQIEQRPAAFKAKLASQKVEPLGSIPRPSPAVPTVPVPKIINPLKVKK